MIVEIVGIGMLYDVHVILVLSVSVHKEIHKLFCDLPSYLWRYMLVLR